MKGKQIVFQTQLVVTFELTVATNNLNVWPFTFDKLDHQDLINGIALWWVLFSVFLRVD